MAQAETREIVNVPLKKLFDAIIGFENYPTFVTGMKSAKIIESNSDNWVADFEIDMGKLVKYRLHVECHLDPSHSSAEVKWKLLESDQLNANNGKWTLKANGADKTDVHYSLEVDFKFPVPSFILKPMIKAGLPKAIQEFSNEAAKKGSV